MALTGFPSGVSSFGVPQVGGGGVFKPYATYYFVDASNFTQKASDGNTGLSPEDPLYTMARAFAIIASNGSSGGSGSVICFIGNVREQISAPLGIFDVTIIGCGNSPRHADAFDGLQGYTAATWRPQASPAAGVPLLTVQSQGWQFMNFLFTGAPANTPGCKIARNSESGDDEIDGGHAQFIGMRFDACPIGLQVATTGFVQVYGSFFRGCTTAAINTTSGGPGTNGFWNIEGNRFYDNENHIIAPLVQSTIKNNDFALFGTDCIDLTGGANNFVGPGNGFSGTYDNSGGYTESGTDTWAGNFTEAGITTANPAA
jgi:hypothetical protein